MTTRKRHTRCWYCGAHLTPAEATSDHVTPRAAGGRAVRSNLVTACRECNQRKGAMSLEAYRAAHNHGAAFWGEMRGL